ncbi:hypothetical protein [Streptomyces sp. NPDC003077]|uniref:hypothetical protein n=1 Tax=Streptomyces sp. NPDC003077 TaxID=3154443 RepID=UPI00339E2DEE
MQPPAGQDLPHTRPRAAHWLATATALAAVVAGAALVQPAGATTTAAAPARDHGPAPDAKAARYPVDCGSERPQVVRQVSGDLDGDGIRETAAVVRCPAGIGTPPSGVYVLARGSGPHAPPRVVATLLAPSEDRSVTEFALRDRTLSATLLGYSSTDVPRCCPDVRERAKWRWHDGTFVRDGATAETKSV